MCRVKCFYQGYSYGLSLDAKVLASRASLANALRSALATEDIPVCLAEELEIMVLDSMVRCCFTASGLIRQEDVPAACLFRLSNRDRHHRGLQGKQNMCKPDEGDNCWHAAVKAAKRVYIKSSASLPVI